MELILNKNMNNQQKLKQLKEQVLKLEEEIKSEPVIQGIPAIKLEWGKLSDERMEWEEAKEWCKKQGKGFRLPTVVELQQAYYDNIPGFGTGSHWSRTEYSETNARHVHFSDGSTYHSDKAGSYSVRCVREI